LGLLKLASGLGAQQTSTSLKLQRTDRNFITKAAAGGHAEVELGQLAEGKASSDAVKQFGQRMIEDHGAANQELMQLAENKGIQLDDKTPKPDRLLTRLSKLQGPEFDREYVKAMVKDHKQDVAELGQEASDRGKTSGCAPALLVAENALEGSWGERSEYTSVSPADTGGDVDGNWQRRAENSGEEPVEILSSRDRRRWCIEQHTEEQAREADEA
jgi:predicted outer membrane protein